MMGSPPDVTAILTAWSRGDSGALDRLLPVIYGELRRMAGRQLRSERTGHTLQPTALVHEVYLRLAGQRRVDWRGRAHFFAVAAQMMRRILVDYARRHAAEKRGGAVSCLAIDAVPEIAAPDEMPILGLDRALDRLQQIDAELARLVELRVFGGLTIDETAHVLNVSPSTAKRDWRTARAWLTRELSTDSWPGLRQA